MVNLNFEKFTWRATQFVVMALTLQAIAFARCPIPENGSLFVRAPLGNLLIDTSLDGFVDVKVSNATIEVEENCFHDRVEIGAKAPAQFLGPIDWHIRVPATINLDLVTFAGGVRVSSTEGNIKLQTTGGSVITGSVGGKAAIVTQGGSILVGDIGNDAELRSLGGGIKIGNVAGNAQLETLGGPITAGIINGKVRAETAGGSINIRESRGDLNAMTLAGDIIIGTASRTTVQTAGGNIIGLLIQGPFQGFTQLGNIRIDHAESWVEATSGMGDIQARVVPASFEGDLHITLRTSSGNIQLEIPENLPANVEAIVDRLIVQSQRIISDFKLQNVRSNSAPIPFGRRFIVAPLIRKTAILNGGGNLVKVQTSRGVIEIRRTRR